MVRKKAKAKTKAKKKKTRVKAKVIAKIEHIFAKISVAVFKLKAPLKVGDYIHIKGHKTDFMQKVTSMQIDCQDVEKAKKGQDVGIKVAQKVRENDLILQPSKEELTAYFHKNQPQKKSQPSLPNFFSRPKVVAPSRVKPIAKPKSAIPQAVPQPKVQSKPRPQPSASPKKSDPYSGTKFLSF